MNGLKDFPAAAVLRAEDFNRARDFYMNVLGLEEMQMPMHEHEEMHEALFMAGDNSAVEIYERPGMPAPQNTTLAFNVPAERFDAVMADLKGRGVKFEDYDIPEMNLKTTNGVAQMDGSKVAWFTDTEGNIVSLNTM